MWYLQHKTEWLFVSCKSYEHARNELYRQWRTADGSIPWTIEYKDME